MTRIVRVLAFALATLATSVHATEWSRWNVAPYATSIAEACRKAPEAIDGLTLPLSVKAEFKKRLGADCKGGTEVWLTPHQKLEAMWSGGTKPHVMQNVTVGELPVLKSPDGRTYRKGAVAETAKALMWSVEHEGKTYVLYLPAVCFNWAWAFGSPVAATEECYELTFNAPVGGKVRWGIATNSGPLPPSLCNAQKQGDGNWAAWYGDCATCVPTKPFVEYLNRKLGATAAVPHKYLYPVTNEKQTLRFSPAAKDAVMYVCLEKADGTKTCNEAFTSPSRWGGKRQIQMPDGYWKWHGDANCPQTPAKK